ncbi:hypothetical protein AAG570_009216 [Ranatra chinensis]|uniref:Major facilitator superfamily (MFS) profile domain-containing protein n=1 Tax=Ranatra chinensis TaxID=642074 RepID=A0ABD0YT76_9HEMI
MLTFLLSLFNAPCTFHIFAPTFEAATPPFWCARPQHLPNLPVDLWKNISGVVQIDSGKENYDPCQMKDLNYSGTFLELIDWSALTEGNIPCQKWEYDTSTYGDTIVTEWDLVCGRKQLSNLAEMMFLLGVAIGGLVSGLISDRFGRKRTLMISLLAQVILGTMVAMTPWYLFYLILRGVLGFFCVSIVFSGFVLCVELVGGKWLTISGVSYLFPLPLSYIAISGIAYYIKGWREFQLVITLPAASFLCFWWILPESPRWLLTAGKVDKVMTVLEEASRFNKKELPPNTDKILKQSVSKMHAEQSQRKVGLMDLFKTPKIRKISLTLYVVWFMVYIVYYGLVLNLSNLGGDVYLNSIISGAVEFPAIAVSILFLLKLGRRWPLCLTTAGAGIACLLTIPCPKDDYGWLTITFAMIGKFCVSSSNVVMPVFTAELFPTFMRNLGVGSSNIPGGIALMLVPYLWNLAGMNVNMPMGILGVCGIVGGLSVLLLPETGKGGTLADTLEEIEETPKS